MAGCSNQESQSCMKALELLDNELVVSITPHIDALLKEAEKSALNISIHLQDKATKPRLFVKSIVRTIRKDPSKFGVFLDTLKAVGPLKYLADKIENKVSEIAAQSNYVQHGASVVAGPGYGYGGASLVTAANTGRKLSNETKPGDADKEYQSTWPQRKPRKGSASRKRSPRQRRRHSSSSKLKDSDSDNEESGFQELLTSASEVVNNTQDAFQSEDDSPNIGNTSTELFPTNASPSNGYPYVSSIGYMGSDVVYEETHEHDTSTSCVPLVDETENSYGQILLNQNHGLVSSTPRLVPLSLELEEKNAQVVHLESQLSREKELSKKRYGEILQKKELAEQKLKQKEIESAKDKEKMEKEIEDLKNKMKDLHSRLANKEKENDTLKKEKQSQRKYYEDQVKKLEQEKVEMDSDNLKTREMYERKIQDLKEELECCSKEAELQLEKMRTKLSEKQNEYKDKVIQFKDKMIQYEVDKRELSDKLHEVQTELSNAREENFELKLQKAHDQTKIVQTEGDKKLKVVRRESTAKDETIAQLQRQLQEMITKKNTSESDSESSSAY